MWDDDYYDEYYPQRPERYEVRRVAFIGEPQGPRLHRIPGKRFSTSPTEIMHLTVAYVVLVICFTMALAMGVGGILYGFLLPEFFIARIMWVLPASLIAVGLGFVLHEMAHKLTAQHYGFWSEFRYDGRGLLMALGFSILAGIVWAAPGATWVSGNPSRRENGIMSFAGPVINMVIAGGLLGFLFILEFDTYIWNTIAISGFIIAFLAVFNMLPFYPLDGSKVWGWNKGIYIIGIFIAGAMTVFYYIAAFTYYYFPLS